MGEIADAMLEGLFCGECGTVLDGDEPGYMRYCGSCKDPGQSIQTEVDRIAKSRKSRKRKRAKDRKELVQQIIKNAEPRILRTCPGPANREGHHGGDPDCICDDVRAIVREVLAEYRMKVNEIV